MPAFPSLSRLLAALTLLAVLALPPVAARAQSLIRDAEIEHALRELLGPVAGAAGIPLSQLRVMVINDGSLNAFVIDGRTIFVHSGLILRLDRAEALQAVIAHELAHIANGHIARRLANLRGANSVAAMGAVLAVGLAASGNGGAAAGVALGTQSSAQRVFFSHSRAEEASADQAGIRYMARAGVDPQAMVEVLDIFRGQEALQPGRQDPYVRTHPLSADRLRAMKGYAAAYGGEARDDPQADYWFARARGKLGAFLQNSGYTLRKVGKTDKSDVAVMRRAIAYHRRPDTEAAVAEVNRLVAMRPNDPYYQELKGQILLESRRFPAAVSAYGRAVDMAPREPLILAGYGRALLALESADGNSRALAALEKARARDPYDPRMLRDLAVAWARAGNNGMASLATAERYALMGRLKDAGTHATRASDLLPHGSAGWLRAQDVLRTAEAAAKRSKR
ncbi:M48 family metalloprotease [Actibacterium sp. MT2.3-13A]|uniref:M48 family metalloprotease n=1 Tax=Actibacterium sp. MT2.3-13A TaxID=2828332 RepID=UPI001BADD178|nr:M48 family metalloprotease [Actibacterium sp. MT2.3-13A]